jgi:hypothetical protein
VLFFTSFRVRCRANRSDYDSKEEDFETERETFLSEIRHDRITDPINPKRVRHRCNAMTTSRRSFKRATEPCGGLAVWHLPPGA